MDRFLLMAVSLTSSIGGTAFNLMSMQDNSDSYELPSDFNPGAGLLQGRSDKEVYDTEPEDPEDIMAWEAFNKKLQEEISDNMSRRTDGGSTTTCDPEVLNVAQSSRSFSSVLNGGSSSSGHAQASLNAFYGWHPDGYSGEWMKMDLGQTRTVVGVVTQGRKTSPNQWVTSYKVALSVDDSNYAYADDGANLPGNNDRNTWAYTYFDTAAEGRYVVIYPQDYYGFPMMRAGALVCPSSCAVCGPTPLPTPSPTTATCGSSTLRDDYDAAAPFSEGAAGSFQSTEQLGTWEFLAASSVNSGTGTPLTFTSSSNSQRNGNTFIRSGQNLDLPAIGLGVDSAVISPSSSEGQIGAGNLGLHPGDHTDSEKYLLVRFTPAAGTTVSFDGVITELGVDCGGLEASVSVGGTTLSSTTAITSGAPWSFSSSAATSDPIEVYIGPGPSFACDHSQISMSVSGSTCADNSTPASTPAPPTEPTPAPTTELCVESAGWFSTTPNGGYTFMEYGISNRWDACVTNERNNQVPDSGRGLNLMILNSDFSVLSQDNYDTHQDTSAATRLANKLGTVVDGQVVMIGACDSAGVLSNEDLFLALDGLGATLQRTYLATSIQTSVCGADSGTDWALHQRYGYALVAVKGGQIAEDGECNGGAARACLTTATASNTDSNNQVSGTGDPHLKNMRGESFDLLRPGKFLLIDIPRGRPVEDALLVVEADAHRLGGDCADLYFVALNITGAWADMAQTGGLRFDAYATPDEKPKWAKFGPVDLKIAHGRTVQGTRYLNVYARHLGRAGFAVGGLLGEDDHSEAVVPTDDCLKKVFLSRKGAGKGLPRAGSVAEAM